MQQLPMQAFIYLHMTTYPYKEMMQIRNNLKPNKDVYMWQEKVYNPKT